MNLLAVLIAAVAALVISGVYYGALGARLAALSSAYADGAGRSPAATVPVELVRGAVLAVVVSVVVAPLTVTGALGSALLLWIGFPVVLLAGSVFHERVPWRLAAIHVGDWLLKLLAVALIVSVWP